MQNLKAHSLSLRQFPSLTRRWTRLTSIQRRCDRCSATAMSALKRVACGPHRQAREVTGKAGRPWRVKTPLVRSTMNPSDVLLCAEVFTFGLENSYAPQTKSPAAIPARGELQLGHCA